MTLAHPRADLSAAPGSEVVPREEMRLANLAERVAEDHDFHLWLEALPRKTAIRCSLSPTTYLPAPDPTGGADSPTRPSPVDDVTSWELARVR